MARYYLVTMTWSCRDGGKEKLSGQDSNPGKPGRTLTAIA